MNRKKTRGVGNKTVLLRKRDGADRARTEKKRGAER